MRETKYQLILEGIIYEPISLQEIISGDWELNGVVFEENEDIGFSIGDDASLPAKDYRFHNNGEGIWRQYTGLKDSNDDEIYEGDVLQVPEFWDTYGFMAGEKREIYFNDGCFRFKPTEEGNGRGHHLEDNLEFEIIGNIYENPDLLPKK